MEEVCWPQGRLYRKISLISLFSMRVSWQATELFNWSSNNVCVIYIYALVCSYVSKITIRWLYILPRSMTLWKIGVPCQWNFTAPDGDSLGRDFCSVCCRVFFCHFSLIPLIGRHSNMRRICSKIIYIRLDYSIPCNCIHLLVLKVVICTFPAFLTIHWRSFQAQYL